MGKLIIKLARVVRILLSRIVEIDGSDEPKITI